jgi:hypothetical protein
VIGYIIYCHPIQASIAQNVNATSSATVSQINAGEIYISAQPHLIFNKAALMAACSDHEPMLDLFVFRRGVLFLS